MAEENATQAVNNHEDDSSKQPFSMSSDNYAVIAKAIGEYEIEHTVHFTSQRKYRNFNCNYEPWKNLKEGSPAPRLVWASDVVPIEGQPYLFVARKALECQYGRQHHAKPRVSARKPSYKIDCPCILEVIEIARMVSPMIQIKNKADISRHHQKLLGQVYKQLVKSLNRGEPANDLKFTREFHLRISPLSSHNHAIGEAAAEHQRIDPVIVEKLHELNSAGITSTDILTDLLKNYVEDTLFKGKTPPILTNRRFYPKKADIKNHAYLTKSQLLKKYKSVADESVQCEEIPVADLPIVDAAIMYGNSSTVTSQQQTSGSGQITEEVIQNALYQQGYPQNTQYEYSQEEVYCDIYPNAEQDQQPYRQVSSYCSVNSEKPKKKKKVTIPLDKQAHSFSSATTTTHGNTKRRTPKEKFTFLVKKLSKVCNVIGDGDHYKKLSSLLAEVLVEAKSLVPLEHIPILFHEDPRPLVAPRRLKKQKLKPKLRVKKQRYPEFVPDAFKLPDKKAIRIAARRKLLAERKLRKAAREAEEERAKAAMSANLLVELREQLPVEPGAAQAAETATEDNIGPSSQKLKAIAESVLLISNQFRLTPGQQLTPPPGHTPILPEGCSIKLPAANSESSNVTEPQDVIPLQQAPVTSLSTPKHATIYPEPATLASDLFNLQSVPAEGSTSSGEPSSSTIIVTLKSADGVSTSTNSNSLTNAFKTESNTIDTNSSCSSLPATTVVTSTANPNTNIPPTNTITTENVDTPAPSTSVPLISDSLSSSTLPCATPVTSTIITGTPVTSTIVTDTPVTSDTDSTAQVVEVSFTSPACTEETFANYTALDTGSSEDVVVYTTETLDADTSSGIVEALENMEGRTSPKVFILETVPPSEIPRVTRSKKRAADDTLLEESAPAKHAMRLREVKPKKT